MPSMLLVARGTFRRERLVGMVNRSVMTSEAGTIARLRAEESGHLEMAGIAFRGEDGMRGRHLSAAVHALVAGDPMPDEPQDGQ